MQSRNMTCYFLLWYALIADIEIESKQFSDPYGTWNIVVVQGIFKITLLEHYATIYLDSNKIQLGSGIICRLADKFCTDVEYG